MIKVQFAAGWPRWKLWKHALSLELARAGLEAELSRNHPADQVDYVIYAPNPEFGGFTPYTRAKAVLSLWAGVEDIVPDKTLTQPLTRMVDTGLREGMVEWVTGHVLRHHLGMDAHIVNPGYDWTPVMPPLARNRGVTILGLGELGAACAVALRALNFRVTGWSRGAKSIAGVTCLSGEAGLQQALADAEILVLLLPLTNATENLMNADRLAMLPEGAMILNPGRGPLIDDAALLAALDADHVGHATLDVFRTEPLPADHPYWQHPRVTVTPHIASETRPETAARIIAENIRRSEAGEPLLHLVDRGAGY